jgi:hypothetical protein
MSSSLTRETDPSSLGGPDVLNEDSSRTAGSKPPPRMMARTPDATPHPRTEPTRSPVCAQTRPDHRTAANAGFTPALSSADRTAYRTSTNHAGVYNRAGTSNPCSSHLVPPAPLRINPSTRGNTSTRGTTPTRNTPPTGNIPSRRLSPNTDQSPIVRSYPSAGSLRAHTPNPRAFSPSPSGTGNVARNSNRGRGTASSRGISTSSRLPRTTLARPSISGASSVASPRTAQSSLAPTPSRPAPHRTDFATHSSHSATVPNLSSTRNSTAPSSNRGRSRLPVTTELTLNASPGSSLHPGRLSRARTGRTESKLHAPAPERQSASIALPASPPSAPNISSMVTVPGIREDSVDANPMPRSAAV